MTAGRKQLRPTRRTEQAAVNRARSLLEAAGLVYQPIDQANDYGKDAYLDLTEAAAITGVCVALQIKGGSSYRKGAGYAIPFDEATARLWRDSSLPVFGIVHDPTSDSLHWCNLTGYIRTHWSGKGGGSVTIVSSTLNEETIGEFVAQASAYVRATTSTWPLGLVDPDDAVQVSSVFDCFALGRSDPRALVLLRTCLLRLGKEATRAAVHVLSHATAHPDIFWTPSNWIPLDVKSEVAASFVWSVGEIAHILSAVPLDEFGRGELGESAFMLIVEHGPNRLALKTLAIGDGDMDVRFAAFVVALYLAGESGRTVLSQMVSVKPDLLSHPMASEVVSLIEEWGYLSLF